MEEMNITLALRRISKIKGQIKTHRDRAESYAHYYVDEPHPFAFKEELDSSNVLADEMVELQARVAIANAMTPVTFEGKKRPLAWAIRHLNEVRGLLTYYRQLQVLGAADLVERNQKLVANPDPLGSRMVYIDVERKRHCDLPEKDKAARVAELEEKEFELNGLIEVANGRTLLPPL